MSWQVVKPQIKTLLETITELQEVSLAPKLEFNGYPAAYVIPSDNEADYETNKENIRTYAFIVRVFYETKQGGISDALSALESLVDSILDKFDQEDLKGSSNRTVGLGLPSDYQFINIFAAPSTWGEVQGAELIMAEIKVRVRISIDIT